MLTLIGDTTLVVKNPKIGNTETVDTGTMFNTSRQGVINSAKIAHMFARRRFDFEWLKAADKDALVTFLLAHIGRIVTIQWTSGSACNQDILDERYILDDQPLEVVTLKDGCSYDCSTYWVRIIEIQKFINTESSIHIITEDGRSIVTEAMQ